MLLFRISSTAASFLLRYSMNLLSPPCPASSESPCPDDRSPGGTKRGLLMAIARDISNLGWYSRARHLCPPDNRGLCTSSRGNGPSSILFSILPFLITRTGLGKRPTSTE
ncbi:uncharacterized protein B0H64DRAFT_152446 [Chaetomium fimeti]|uniref:Uncharacterized protein n=1 Tax=Chaetomium fimeti TaxID=1854472 RepID=A0AAE0LSZ4_9PEZI|nr:hypothetical protein B0H64DRAFT_152446 [Chaetomium fimeti]